MPIQIDNLTIRARGRAYDAELHGPALTAFTAHGRRYARDGAGTGVTWADGTHRIVDGHVTVERLDDATARVRVTSADVVAELDVHAGPDELHLQPRIVSASRDVAAASVHAGLDAGLELHVPSCAGMRFAPDHDLLPMFNFEWPRTWSAALVIADGDDAGVAVYADDPDCRAKDLIFSRASSTYGLALVTEEQAPFTGRRNATGLVWRIRPYSGPWEREPIHHYQQRIPAPKPVPAWVGDVRLFMSFSSFEHDFLETLAPHVVPHSTVLHADRWRARPYDVGYPDYAPRADFAERLSDAHAHGMRVMPHFNAFAVDLSWEGAKRFAEFQIRDRFSGEALGWKWPPDDPQLELAYIHTGSDAWRATIVDRAVETMRVHGADGIFMDQTFHGYNHAGGLVDGRNVTRGMQQVLIDLHDALGPVAIGGEGISEVTAPYQAFSQVAHFGFMFLRGWFLDETQVTRLASPINRVLFEPYTRSVVYWPFWGHMGAGATAVECYRRIGAMASFSHLETAMITNPEPETLEIFEAARAGRPMGA